MYLAITFFSYSTRSIPLVIILFFGPLAFGRSARFAIFRLPCGCIRIFLFEPLKHRVTSFPFCWQQAHCIRQNEAAAFSLAARPVDCGRHILCEGAWTRQNSIRKTKPSGNYRVLENYPFSWHIASQHPWFGIGLWSVDACLETYSLKYPYMWIRRQPLRAAGCHSENTLSPLWRNWQWCSFISSASVICLYSS